jgi:hypothetical protein
MGAFPFWIGTWGRPIGLFGPDVDGWLRHHSALFRYAEGQVLAHWYEEKELPLDWNYFHDVAPRVLADCKGAGVPLVVYALPPHVVSLGGRCDERARQGPGWCGQSVQGLATAEAWFRNEGLDVVDGVAAYRVGGPADLTGYQDDVSHPGEAGQARLAAAMIEPVARALRARAAVAP